MELTYSDVAEILKMIDASSCEELVLEMKDIRLVVRKSSQGSGSHAVSEKQNLSVPTDTANVPHTIAEGSEQAESGEPSEREETTYSADALIVKAPMVGTFYRRPSPGKPAFVEIGSSVKPGDALCVIEVRKLFTQIECQQAGTVEAILAEDGKLVEYGQPLFRVVT